MIISCAKTNLPILIGPAWEGHPFSKAVLLREGAPPLVGYFDSRGRLGSLDLRAAETLERLRSGAVRLVLASRYSADDSPAIPGSSRVDFDARACPGRLFLAACTSIEKFETYQGYVLARDGRVPPVVGARLTQTDIAVMTRMTENLRLGIARCLVASVGTEARRATAEIEASVAPSIMLEVVPSTAEPGSFSVIGDVGNAVTRTLDGDVLRHSPMQVATDLLTHFPPQKKGSAVLELDDRPLGAVALCRASALGMSVYIEWMEDGLDMFGTAAQLVESLEHQGLSADDLEADLLSLESGADVTISMKPARGPNP